MASLEMTRVAGEQQAEDFDTLFLRHWSEIHRLLYRMLGDEAEDAAQDVFIKLHTRPPEPGSNYRAWLYKVATREGLNRLRTRHRRDGLLGRLTALWSAQPDPGPEDVVQGREQQHAVRAVLAKMRPVYGQALLLRHEGLDYMELSQTLGVGRSSVGTLLLRAERQFEKLYEEAGGRF